LIDKIGENKTIKEMNLIIQNADINNIYEIQSLIYHTIDNNFVKIYPQSVNSYLKSYHSIQSISDDIRNGYCIIGKINNSIVATGTLINNYIKSLYVNPLFQRKGIGSIIINYLEQYAINNNVKEILIDATIGSENFYVKLGYKIIELKRWKINDSTYMNYYEIKKTITNE